MLWNYINLWTVVASLNLHFQVNLICHWKTQPSCPSGSYLPGFTGASGIQAGSGVPGGVAARAMSPRAGTAACCTEEHARSPDWLPIADTEETTWREQTLLSNSNMTACSVRMALPATWVGGLEGFLAEGAQALGAPRKQAEPFSSSPRVPLLQPLAAIY